jgi:hypothetical protein
LLWVSIPKIPLEEIERIEVEEEEEVAVVAEGETKTKENPDKKDRTPSRP